MLSRVAVVFGLTGLAYAQFPPKPEGVTLLKSKFHENVTISLKEPGICETTPGVKSYSGYVHLPAGLLEEGGEAQNYSINTFFWFFEARKDPQNAPLAIWLNGGPGGSSMMGLLEENGPCIIGPDSKTTYLNPWSWNNEVNMLYIDQPTQVGFSYDVPTNGTQQLVGEGEEAGFITVPGDFTEVTESNLTYRVGTFASQDNSKTANTTAFAAHALWHFAQIWFFEFPNYKPNDDRISLWAESYGGHYGPGIFRFFQEQNEKIANGSSKEKDAQFLHLDTLGIVNGLIDLAIAGEAWITYAYNNTYGIQAFNQSIYDELMYNWTRPGGIKEMVDSCQAALKDRDSVDSRRTGTDWRKACGPLKSSKLVQAVDIYLKQDHGWYDIAHRHADPFPAPYMYGYMTEESVLSALGVPVNYSSGSGAVSTVFQETFDILHGGFLESIGYLLDAGLKVVMMYGDRDYACNWVGGEKSSIAVPWSRSAEFAQAGYAPLLVTEGPAGSGGDGLIEADGPAVVRGLTRQVGNLSFTRVFQAGHEVPSYQPAAAYAIFQRATFNRDVATGLLPATDDLVTEGPRSVWHIKNDPPEVPEPRCNVLKPDSCTPSMLQKIKAGEVIVEDWFVAGVTGDVEEDGADNGREGTATASAGMGEDNQRIIGGMEL